MKTISKIESRLDQLQEYINQAEQTLDEGNLSLSERADLQEEIDDYLKEISVLNWVLFEG